MMSTKLQQLVEQATHNVLGVRQLDSITLAELIVKECAYLVNHQQRTTGYTTHAQMLCREFGIEYRDEDYYGRE